MKTEDACVNFEYFVMSIILTIQHLYHMRWYKIHAFQSVQHFSSLNSEELVMQMWWNGVCHTGVAKGDRR